MQPIHDVDVLLLLTTAMAAKRRPAELIEIMAAIDLVQGNIPSEDKLSDSLVRLGTAGLLVQVENRVGLTATAEGLIKLLPRRGESRSAPVRTARPARRLPAGGRSQPGDRGPGRSA
jgi:hypothetical protein